MFGNTPIYLEIIRQLYVRRGQEMQWKDCLEDLDTMIAEHPEIADILKRLKAHVVAMDHATYARLLVIVSDGLPKRK